MTSEQQKQIAEFFRKFVTLMADFSALHGILVACENARKAPIGWQSLWQEMQHQPDYIQAVKAYDPLIAALQQAKSESALIELIHKISDTPRPN